MLPTFLVKFIHEMRKESNNDDGLEIFGNILLHDYKNLFLSSKLDNLLCKKGNIQRFVVGNSSIKEIHNEIVFF